MQVRPLPCFRPPLATRGQGSGHSVQQPLDHYVIFGKDSSEIPAAIADVVCQPELKLGGFPSQRWVVTPQIEASHRHYVGSAPEAELRDGPSSELRTLIGPMLLARYRHQQGLTVAELGPSTSTTVAESLANGSNRYIGVDLSEPLAEKQIEFLLADGVQAFYNVKGDTYALPLKSESCDLILTSCHPPFVSSSLDDRKLALDEIHRALKPGGEFLLFPYDQRKQPAEFQAYLAERFELVEQRLSPLGHDRQAVVLQKRA
ncbi:MAG: class I SAM-dependent methyltransferase [Vulcanimicrobiota bacterium]